MKQLRFPFYDYHILDDRDGIELSKNDIEHRSVIKIDVSDVEYDAIADICKEYGVDKLPEDYMLHDMITVCVYLRLMKAIDDYLLNSYYQDSEEFIEYERGYFGIDEYEEMPNHGPEVDRYILTLLTKKVVGAPLEFDREFESFLRKAGTIR